MDKLDVLEQMVWQAIPTGHRRAINKERLAQQVGLPVRKVREIIEHLVVEHGLPIGSSTDRVTGGYFVITDEQDLAVATRHLKPRATAIFKRLRALERIAERKFGAQLSLLDELTG